MKKSPGIILFTVLLSQLSLSQNLDWANSMGNSGGDDEARSVAVDATGNVYVTGWFFGTTDFDPGTGTLNLVSNGSADIFIQKLSPTGNLLWVKSIGSTGDDRAYSIAVDASQNIHLTGEFENTVDMDPGSGTTNRTAFGAHDLCTMKLDPSGNLLWAFTTGEANNERGHCIRVDNSGNVYTTGYFFGTNDFDPGPSTFNLATAGFDRDIFIQKLDASGNLVWAKSEGGSNTDEGNSLFVDSGGNVYITGFFQDGADFDPGPAVNYVFSHGWYDIFVQKLNASGNFMWAKAMGCTSNTDIGYSIAVDASGNVYTTGYFNNTCDFDPSSSFTYNLYATGGRCAFIQKLDNGGNFIWAKCNYAVNNDEANGLALDASDNVYITGFFFGTVDFDPSPTGTSNLTSAGGWDVFVQKLNSSGNFVWAKNFGGASGLDKGYGITVDPSDNVYLAGFYNGTSDFDIGTGTYNITSLGMSDVYVAKWNQTITGLTENIYTNTMNIFPNPFSNSIFVETDFIGTSQILIYNVLGETVFIGSSNEQKTEIDPGNIPTGIYFVKITNSEGMMAIHKIIKE